MTDFCSLSSLISWLDSEASMENYRAPEQWFSKCSPWTKCISSKWDLLKMQIPRPTTSGEGPSNGTTAPDDSRARMECSTSLDEL